ncbi:fibronectin type III domain-containing protein [Nocardioides sp. NPDC000445]|uniref:fibronectin type III domain-containing protein n=1 Tax=Nocardioides sp. NPDC000445 TaxID=3154257 RepID=UPI003316B7F8
METTARNRTIGGIVIGAIILILLLVLFSCTVNSDPESSPTKDPTTGESSLPSDPDTLEPDDKPSEKDSDEPEVVDDDIVPAANTGVTFIPAGNVPSGSTPTCELDPSACEDTRPPGAGVDICEIRPDLTQCQPPPTTPPGGGDGDDGDGDGDNGGPICGIWPLPDCDDDETAPPACPTFEVSKVKSRGATVSWSAVRNADAYVVVVDPGLLEQRETFGADQLSTRLRFRVPGVTHDVTVRAVNNDVTSEGCGSKSFTLEPGDDFDPPAQPQGVTCVIGKETTTSVELNWADNTEDDFAEYSVSVSGPGQDDRTVTGLKKSEATIGELLPGSDYSFRVTAWDENDNESRRSDVAECSTLEDVEKPTVPEIISVGAATGDSLTVTWKPSKDDSAIREYIVRRDGSEIGRIAGTTFVDDGLEPETTYEYTVEAVDIADPPKESGQSVTKAGTTTKDEPPAKAPGDLSVSSTPLAGAYTVAWAIPGEDKEDSANELRYQIFVDDAAEPEVTDEGADSWTSGILQFGDHTVRVKTLDTEDQASVNAASITFNVSALGVTTQGSEVPLRSQTPGRAKSDAPADKPALPEAPVEVPSDKPAEEDSPLLPGLDDILPGGEDTAEAPAEEPAEPEATPSESESPAARPTTEEPADEATEEAPAEEDEGGLLDDIGDALTSAVAAVF